MKWITTLNNNTILLMLKGSKMNLTKDKIKDRIFELELEQKEIQMCLTQAALWGNDKEFLSTQEHYNKLNQENQCWIAYYKDCLKDIENEEKSDE